MSADKPPWWPKGPDRAAPYLPAHEIWAGMPEYVIAGVEFPHSIVRSLLPAELEPVDRYSGGFVSFSTHGNSRLPAFDVAHVWIDVKGYDAPDGSPARFSVGGIGTTAIVSDFARVQASVKLVEGHSHTTSKSGLIVSESDSNEARFRLAVRPTGRPSVPTSYTLNYVGFGPTGDPTTRLVRVFNEFEDAEPLRADFSHAVATQDRGLVPTRYLWAGRPRNAVFVIDTEIGWPDRAVASLRDRRADERLLGLIAAMRRPAFLVEADCAVSVANDAARSVLGDGLVIINGHLSALDRQEGALRWLIAAACRSAEGDALQPVAVSRRSHRTPLIVQAIPIGRGQLNAVDITGSGDNRALVMVTDLDQPLRVSTSELELLGLTRAEARIASVVGSGVSSRQAAVRLGIAENTVRSALSLIYGKLQIRKQTELALVVARLSAVN